MFFGVFNRLKSRPYGLLPALTIERQDKNFQRIQWCAGKPEGNPKWSQLKSLLTPSNQSFHHFQGFFVS